MEGKAVGDPSQVLGEFVEGNVLALQNLGKIIARDDLANAVKLISQAETVYVAGFRRSFPVAAYLAYSLLQVDKKTVFIDSLGGMSLQQVHGINERDLLIAVSYHPYAGETVHVVDAAVEKGCKVLSISDSLVSPVAKPAIAGAAGARGRDPQVPFAVGIDVPGPGAGDFLRIRGHRRWPG